MFLCFRCTYYPITIVQYESNIQCDNEFCTGWISGSNFKAAWSWYQYNDDGEIEGLAADNLHCSGYHALRTQRLEAQGFDEVACYYSDENNPNMDELSPLTLFALT